MTWNGCCIFMRYDGDIEKGCYDMDGFDSFFRACAIWYDLVSMKGLSSLLTDVCEEE